MGATNTNAVLVAAQFDDGGRLTADYKFDYTNFRGSQLGVQLLGLRGAGDPPQYNPLGGTAAFVLSLQPGLGGTNVISTKPLSALYEGERASDKFRAQGHSLTLNFDLSDQIKLKNIAAYRKTYQLSLGNAFQGNHLIDPFGGSGGDFSFLNAISTRPQHQYSEEFQVLGNTGPVTWVGGAFYFIEKASNYNPAMFFKVYPRTGGPVPITPADNFSDVKVRNKSAAIFAQGTYAITDALSLTAGVRHTWDKRREENLLTTPATLSRVSFNKATWQASADYRVNPDIMVYAKAGTGYLSGGIYNGRAFNPENLIAYEAGVKSELFDQTLRLNAAGFYGRYRNQITQVFTTFLTYENAARARIHGAEVEATLVPARGLTISASLGALGFKYLEYISTVFGGGNIAGTVRRAATPKLTFAPSIQYDTLPVMNSGAYIPAQLDAVYRSRTFFPVNPFADPALDVAANSKAHWVFNGRISLADLKVAKTNVRLSLWGQNLFNERYVQHSADISGIVAGSFNRPRTFGFDVSASF